MPPGATASIVSRRLRIALRAAKLDLVVDAHVHRYREILLFNLDEADAPRIFDME